MGVATGCGCKEVYRFLILLNLSLLLLYLFFFAAASLLFVHLKKIFFRSCVHMFQYSDNGWVTADLFITWFKFFIEKIATSKPVLLIWVGHAPHIPINQCGGACKS